jgi:hypothetical protein
MPMADGDMVIGLDGSFLYGTAGSSAATETDVVDNVQFNGSADVVERLKRGKTWKSKKVVSLDVSLTFDITSTHGDAFVTAVKTAYLAKGKLALWPKEAEGEGLDADYYITGFNRSETNGDVNTYAVTAVITDEQRDPSWH